MLEPTSGVSSTLSLRVPRVKPLRLLRYKRRRYVVLDSAEEWLFGRNKGAYWCKLLEHALDGTPREWSHSYARLKMGKRRCGRTMTREARRLLESLGMIQVVKPKPRRVNLQGRWRRRGDYVIVQPDAIVWLVALFDQFGADYPTLPITELHAWCIRTARDLRAGDPEPSDLPRKVPDGLIAALMERLKTANPPAPPEEEIQQISTEDTTGKNTEQRGTPASAVGPMLGRILTPWNLPKELPCPRISLAAIFATTGILTPSESHQWLEGCFLEPHPK